MRGIIIKYTYIILYIMIISKDSDDEKVPVSDKNLFAILYYILYMYYIYIDIYSS